MICLSINIIDAEIEIEIEIRLRYFIVYYVICNTISDIRLVMLSYISSSLFLCSTS